MSPYVANIFPLLLRVIDKKQDEFVIFGDDYNTKDGIYVRDYIHVTDLANAHLWAFRKQLETNKSVKINLGNDVTYFQLKDYDFGDDLKTFDQVYELIGTKEFDAYKHGEDSKVVFMNSDGRFFCKEELSGKAVETCALNLSWTPIYIYQGILKHFKKNRDKPQQPFLPSAKTLAQISVLFRQQYKLWRKRLKKKLKGQLKFLVRTIFDVRKCFN